MPEANTLNITIENDGQLPTLYQVSVQGDVVGLRRLIREDALVLDRVSVVTFFNETPLHIAAMRGHSDLARELVSHKPQLAGELDSLHRVPLHWACEKGFTVIVKQLLQKHPDACFLRDKEGRVPLHLAVMKGRNDVILELVRTRPKSTREKVESGGTVLHLCVKYNNLEAIKLLVETAKGSELANATDDHGNTVLHLAVIFKQVEITKYLLSETIEIQKNALNANGFTALDAAEHSEMDSKAMEIKILLLEAGVDKRITRHLSTPQPKTSEPIHSGCSSIARKCQKWWRTYMKTVENRLEQARGNVLVAATVTASMAFQAGINPPKFNTEAPETGINPLFNTEAPETAAPPISYNPYAPSSKSLFWLYNSLSLIFSLVLILLMQSGIPFRNKFTNVVSVIAMGLTVLSIAFAYYHAVEEALSLEGEKSTIEVLAATVGAVFFLIIIVHVCTFILHLVFKMLKYLKTFVVCFFCFPKVA